MNLSGNGVMTRSIEEKSGSADGIIRNSNTLKTSRSVDQSSSSNADKLSTQSLPRLSGVSRLLSVSSSRPSSLNRESSDPSLSPCLERRPFGEDDEVDSPPSPPPKPVRAAVGQLRNDIKDLPIENGPLNRVVSYHASGSDSGNGSGDSAQSSAAGDPSDLVFPQHRGGVIIKNPRFQMPNSASSATLKSFADIDVVAAEQALLALNVPILELASQYDLENFHTLLLPSVENKPLDNGALNTFRMMLSETGPRVLANHLTRVDIKLILGDPDGEVKQMPLDSIGIELITLGHGDQFRMDLIERTECIKLLVAVTILTCASDAERAETLNKWIQVAVDTKTALGNLFGFCSIMLGLCMPQVRSKESMVIAIDLTIENFL